MNIEKMMQGSIFRESEMKHFAIKTVQDVARIQGFQGIQDFYSDILIMTQRFAE